MALSNIELLTPVMGLGKPMKNDGFVASRSGIAEAHRKIEQTINFMGTHLSEPMQVNSLASMVNVSPSHFYALFKQYTGFAPIDFFIRLRMKKACELLETTTLSVKEVAAKLGYDDPFYFSRVFKSVNQVAPSEYRNLSTECNGASENSPSFRTFPHSNLLVSGIARQLSQTPILSPWTEPTPTASQKVSVKKT